ncbi:PorP/SprF family type IX secretion system membrane protein [Spongiimicrobium salis]|uniref:PorP/SprF family type IX secretion system membrane protein n=1 Tax=Spongiimicrobium salis TaxID=1667022 RepID=UPI00374CD279
MIRTKKVLIAVAIFWGIWGNAQQLPQFTQYLYNTVSVNPAYAGSRENLNVTALHRNQWSGLDGNPTTSTFTLHAPLRNDRVGVGFSYISDDLGFERTNYIYGDFSYTVPVQEGVNLSFGLKAGFTSYYLTTPDASDNFFNNNGTVWNPNFGVGAYISSDRWFAGISSPRILNTDLNNGEFEALERNSYYAIGGVVMDVSPDLKFKPSVITKFTEGAPSTYDVSANFLLYEKLWIGATYRFNFANNFGAILDYQVFKDVRIGYAYDLPTSEFSQFSTGTHEIVLIYEPFSKKKGGVKSPRYF